MNSENSQPPAGERQPAGCACESMLAVAGDAGKERQTAPKRRLSRESTLGTPLGILAH